MSITCKKCGTVNEDNAAIICPNCGVVYAKIMPGKTEWKIPIKKEPSSRTTSCPDCGGKVSLRADNCPHCGAIMSNAKTRAASKTKASKTNGASIGGFLFTLILGLLLWYWLFPAKPPVHLSIYQEPKIETPESLAQGQWGMCREYMRSTLKAPATAIFPPPPQVIPTSDYGYWVFQSYVDAQNGFGALIRTHWTCTVKAGNETAEVIYLHVNGRKIPIE